MPDGGRYVIFDQIQLGRRERYETLFDKPTSCGGVVPRPRRYFALMGPATRCDVGISD